MKTEISNKVRICKSCSKEIDVVLDSYPPKCGNCGEPLGTFLNPDANVLVKERSDMNPSSSSNKD